VTAPGDLLYRMVGEVDAADRRIRPAVRETPLEHAPALSAAWGCEVFLKLENTQLGGSFKIRGALNRLLTTPVSSRALGVVAASTGNHGVAVAHAVRQLRVPGVVYVPRGASPAKLAAMRALGAEVREHGTDGVEAEREARRWADETGRVYVSPYNDPQVVAGQGTVGAELVRQLDRVDALCVAVGGGGLVSGVAGYLRAAGRDPVVIGCSPANSPVMHESVAAGRIVDRPSEPTLSDGTAGGIEAEAVTFPLCRTLVHEWHLASEAEIARAMRQALDAEHQLAEGAAGVALAVAARVAPRFAGGNLVVILCGGNVGSDTLRRVLA
jgi:threonine dehydratase